MATGMGIKQYQSNKQFHVVKYDISENGETVTVANTGTPIDGINIIVPPGAISKDGEIFLGYETGKFLPTIHGIPSRIVLVIETPGITNYENPIEVIVPLATMEKDWIGVAGYKIDKEGQLEPLTTISLDKVSNRATFVTFAPLKMTWVYY
ncbi:hypothetical protein JYU06_03580 [Desulfotalea psychrophila]|uniref:Uncharacterized protein n=1 Tax=Desulfotalea psychrophila TaxID=84980 RepID=A0ABS3AUD6_9BACT|nr:hypothetical protein [Desulfotalea psychrophila]